MDTKDSLHETHVAFKEFSKEIGDRIAKFLATTELEMVRHVVAARDAGYVAGHDDGYAVGCKQSLELLTTGELLQLIAQAQALLALKARAA